RALSRRARTNAQASLDRLRGEPRRRQILATAEGIFANANRLLRAAMALEATRQSAAPLSDRRATEAFAASVDQAMLALARALREGKASAIGSVPREAQSRLRDALRAPAPDYDPVLVAAWIDASDRIADSIGTLAHLLARDVPRANR
ncbi:MAG TPA: hypothetical protein VLS52_06400, partial [Rudaea sp.]|nr:hypothetical protein [Rudaea sp.]